MNVLAAIIATYGLFANSPAVVISAMIVAVLLGPIVGISLALVDIDTKLLVKSLTSLLVGAIGVVATAFIIGTIHQDIPITNEIMARTAPNLLDLMVALAGGAAGAYATVSPRLSIAVVGVAIAVALVPALSAAGVLFARGEVDLAFSPTWSPSSLHPQLFYGLRDFAASAGQRGCRCWHLHRAMPSAL
jgi:uncharacterized hydrophobic protein (TIGR00271 family)